MAKQLTDKQKKKIIADYIETQNYSEVARKYNVEPSTIMRIINKEDSQEMQEKAKEKKEENTRDILAYMDTLYEKKKEVLRLSVENMIEKLKEKKVSPNSLAVIYGTMLDKEFKSRELTIKNKEIDKTERKEIVIVNDMPKDDEVDEEDNN